MLRLSEFILFLDLRIRFLILEEISFGLSSVWNAHMISIVSSNNVSQFNLQFVLRLSNKETFIFLRGSIIQAIKVVTKLRFEINKNICSCSKWAKSFVLKSSNSISSCVWIEKIRISNIIYFLIKITVKNLLNIFTDGSNEANCFPIFSFSKVERQLKLFLWIFHDFLLFLMFGSSQPWASINQPIST